MVEKRNYNGLTWIDASCPTSEEVRALVAEYRIAPRAGEELFIPTTKPKVDPYADHLYLILHFPAAGLRARTGATQEIDFVIGKDFLLTVHYEPVEPLRVFAKAFEVGALRDRGLGDEGGTHGGHLFSPLLKSLYGSLLRDLEHLESTLVAIEKSVFEESDRSLVGRLSLAGRELLAFKQATRLHHDVLESLQTAGGKVFGEDFKESLTGALGAYYRVREALESNKELLHELRVTHDALVSAKQNEVIRTLTIISFAILPLALIAAIFTMDVPDKPLSASPHGFYGVLIIMLVTLGGIVGYFKMRKWL
ncbi:MAG TPA: CorA family divalent cation transporter [Candidatus Paceibacterota bacterium]|nr:CorA family divalent cation transporter [Candidatus Paceibacterota bacterium]